jgi:predicted kinase
MQTRVLIETVFANQSERRPSITGAHRCDSRAAAANIPLNSAILWRLAIERKLKHD